MALETRPRGGSARDRDEAVATIVRAARACFARNGVQRTTMEAVARDAAMSRPTIYRYVSGREELVELAMLERCSEISAELLADAGHAGDDLPTRLVERVLGALTIARHDDEFAYLTDAIPRLAVGSFLSSPRSAMNEVVTATFLPLLNLARADGLLRVGPSDHDILELIQGTLVLFAPRMELTEAELRRRIELFLLPAVFG